MFSDKYNEESSLTYENGQHAITNNVTGNRYEVALTELKAATKYSYRAYVYVDGNYHYGKIKSFTTHNPEKNISVSTDGYTNKQLNYGFNYNITLNGTTNAYVDDDEDITYGFIYYNKLNGDGTLVKDSLSHAVTATNIHDGEFSAKLDVDGLETWYYRAYVCIGGKYIYGSIEEINAMNVKIETLDATNISFNNATLNATADFGDLEGNDIQVGFVYSDMDENPYYGVNGSKVCTSEYKDGSFSSEITTLNDGTTYYYRAYVTVRNSGRYIYGNVKQAETPFLVETIEQKGAVDLGLSVKWAACNIGAKRPMEYGDYFAWGETKTKGSYTRDNCKTHDVKLNDISGNSEYDAARTTLGNGWRMPTKEEMEELIDKCSWTWKTYNGIEGYVITGKNDKSIFLPAGDLKNDDPEHKWNYYLDIYGDYLYGYGNSYGDYYENYYGASSWYWTSTPVSASYGEIESFGMGGKGIINVYRHIGMCIRPVHD